MQSRNKKRDVKDERKRTNSRNGPREGGEGNQASGLGPHVVLLGVALAAVGRSLS